MHDQTGDQTGDQAARKVVMEAYERWKSMPPLAVPLGRADVYLLVRALQSLSRSPEWSVHLREIYRGIGRRLQEAVCDDAELYALTEAGWKPVKRAPRAGGAT